MIDLFRCMCCEGAIDIERERVVAVARCEWPPSNAAATAGVPTSCKSTDWVQRRKRRLIDDREQSPSRRSALQLRRLSAAKGGAELSCSNDEIVDGLSEQRHRHLFSDSDRLVVPALGALHTGHCREAGA